MFRLALAGLAAAGLSVCFAAEKPKAPKPKPAAPKQVELAPGTYARIQTEKGTIVIRLFVDKAPETAKNFIELAKGERPFKDSEGRWVQRPFYNALTFHRIEDGALKLIQGGCPTGDGTGGPGYRFDDELDDALTFAKAGVVAMANSGRDTNGSQIFITCAPAVGLNNRFTIFGEVVQGLDVVATISKMPARPSGPGRSAIHMAEKPVVMKSVTIDEIKADEKKPPATK